MKTKGILLIIVVLLFLGCNNSGEKIIEDYLNSVDNVDTLHLEKILSNNFTLTYLDSTYNKRQFNKTVVRNTLLSFQTRLITCNKINDSIYITKEKSITPYQRFNNLIPAFEREKRYCIVDGVIKTIKSDTLKGTKETSLILDYLSNDFGNWLSSQKTILDTLKLNKNTFSYLISNFLKSYPIEKILSEKPYRIDKYIELVKNYHYQDGAIDITFEKAFKQIAGLEGTLDWRSFSVANYANNPNIKAVEVIINRNKKNSKYNIIKLQYIVNIQNDYVELKYGEVNGKPQSIFDTAMTVSLLLSSGSYI